MGRNKNAAATIQEYYHLSMNYLESAKLSLRKDLYEPAMFSAIHALELSLKAALLTKTETSWKTHNIGGQFSKYFRAEIGETTCRRINVILAKYNLPRYPSEQAIDHDDVEKDIAFIEEFITHQITTVI